MDNQEGHLSANDRTLNNALTTVRRHTHRLLNDVEPGVVLGDVISMDINTDDGIVINVLLTRRWFIYAYRLASGETVAQALRLIDIHLNPETEKRLHTHSEVHLKEPGRPRRHNDDAILQLGNTPEAAAFASALADRRSQALNAL